VDTQGLVTIMHVDVEGSTALTMRAGDEAARNVLTETKRIVRERVEAFGGREIDAVGDAMMMTFTSTRAAIAGATAVQEELAARERERPDETLRVRIGLNVGEVLERYGTPFGAAVNAGARVMSKAAGGEILVSETVRQLAGTVPGISYRDRGRHMFKGFDEAWRLYEVVWPGAPPKRPKQRLRRSRHVAFAGVAALVVLIAAAVVAFRLTRESEGLSEVRPNSVGVIEPVTNRVVAEVAVGIRPGPLAFGGGSVWVGDLDDRDLRRIDPRKRTVSGTIGLNGRTPTAIAVSANALWVAHGALGELSRVDFQFNNLSAPIKVIGAPPTSQNAGVAVGEGAVWAAFGDSTLVRVDPKDFRTEAGLTGDAPAGIAIGGGSVWVANSGDNSVDRFNPGTFDEGRLGQPISVGKQPQGIAYGAGAIWVVCVGDDVVWRIDPADRSPRAIEVGDGPTAVAVGEEAVWVSNTAGRTVSRIDPVTSEVVSTIDVGAAPAGISVGGGYVWVAVQAP